MSSTPPLPKRDKAGRVVCTVTFTDEQTSPAEETALQKLGEKVKIEGFRPGKIPTEMLREHVSPEQLFEETIRTLMPETIRKLIEENELKPIIPPKVEAQSREPLSLQLTFVEHPEVTLKGAEKIRSEKKETKLEQKKEIDHAASDGNRVTMDFWGENEEGKEVDGTRTKDHQVILGSKSLIPGFEEELTGLKKGENKTFTIPFPKDYHAEKLQGKPVTFHVTITKVEEVSKPKLTDAFVQEHLGAASTKEFEEKIRKSMVEQEERVGRQEREQDLLKKVRNATNVELAEELIEEEMRDLMQDLSQQLEQNNLSFDDWLKKTGKKSEDLEKELKEQAKDRLTLRFGIQKLVTDREIDLTDEEMEAAVTALLAPLADAQREQTIPMYQKGRQGWEQLKWQKRVEKLMETMLE